MIAQNVTREALLDRTYRSGDKGRNTPAAPSFSVQQPPS